MLFWVVLLLCELFPATMIALAFQKRLLTESQMVNQGIIGGWPLIYFGPIWGDVLILSPLMAWIFEHFGKQWTGRHVFIGIIVGLGCSIILHLFGYRQDNFDSAFVINHKLTSVSLVHVAYFASVVTCVYLFFFATVFTAQERRLVFWSLIGFLAIFNYAEPFWYMGKRLLSIGTLWEIVALSAVFTTLYLYKR